MTYKQFETSMTELLSIKKDIDSLNNAFRKLDRDFNYISFSRNETLIIDVIRIAMNDEHDNIGYWLYELNAGKDWKK